MHKNCQQNCKSEYGNIKTLFKWTLTIVMQVLFLCYSGNLKVEIMKVWIWKGKFESVNCERGNFESGYDSFSV